MWSACSALGEIRAYLRATGSPRGAKSGIVVRVNQIVRRARMRRIPPQHVLHDGRRLHRRAQIRLATRAQAQEGERVQARPLEVGRVLLLYLRHRRLVGPSALLELALPVQGLHGPEIGPLPRISPSATASPVPQPRQRCARSRGVVLAPDGVIVGERLAPIGHREAGVDSLRLPKRLGRICVLEAVEQGQSSEERCLGPAGARIGEAHQSSPAVCADPPVGRAAARNTTVKRRKRSRFMVASGGAGCANVHPWWGAGVGEATGPP